MFAFRYYVLRAVGINLTEALEREKENTIPGTYCSMQQYSGRGMYQFAKVPWKFLKDFCQIRGVAMGNGSAITGLPHKLRYGRVTPSGKKATPCRAVRDVIRYSLRVCLG